MVVQKGLKKEMSPEEQMRRKFRAKCLFRALGRQVIANTYWMIEDIDEYEGVEDVKRRVQQAVRGKAKKKQLLGIKDKVLLNKDAADRTDQEKKYIYRIIGGLKCFKRYPQHVKKKLAAVTYFKYYGPGRVIVRQHQEAHALYFIVTGEVVVSQMVYDEIIEQYVSVELGVMRHGDMFGEVSLLHNIPRTATCTTVGHCELLQLMKEDFKNVLQASIQKQWDEVREAMSAFTYFDSLDEVARREGCIVAKLKSFDTNETILGDGIGIPNFVYFILSGRCQMIESIQVIVSKRLGKEYYTLYDPYVPKEEGEQDFDKKYFGAYQNLPRSSGSSDTGDSQQKQRVSQVSAPKVAESILKSAGSKQAKASSVQIVEGERRASVLGEEENEDQASADKVQERQSSLITPRTERSYSIRSEGVIMSPPQEVNTRRESVRMSVTEKAGKRLPPKFRTFFMQVCEFKPGSSFGFGENMRDRRIVALTPVDCLLLPMIWLLQRNTANIWTRIQHYLEKKIPSKKQLFKQFVTERNWQVHRDQMVEEIVARSNTVNWTSSHDVPYSIRMEELLDI